jgi:toxin ParE1/3/4
LSRIQFTPEAARDLNEIWDYIARDNVDAASRFTATIEETCRLLAASPEMGRRRPELARDLRSFPVGSYVVFYRPVGRGVEIVRVLSAARDIPSLF